MTNNTHNPNIDFGAPDASTDESTNQPTTDDIQAHYKDAKAALNALGRLNDESEALVNADFVQWYLTRDHPNPTEQESIDGFLHQRRARLFCQDIDQTVDDIERVMYATTSYKHPGKVDWVAAMYRDDYDPDTHDSAWEYAGTSNPMPGADAITALSVWGDMDLTDALKDKRGDGGLSDEEQRTAEAAFEAYIDEFAALVGGRDAVFALDSVGGMYMMTAPAVTQPVAKKFGENEEKRQRIFREIIDRSNDYLEDARERVNDSVDGAEDVVDPDFVNNINRAYKAPLSVHKDHDAVVTPVSTDDPQFTATPTAFNKVDDQLRTYTQKWTEAFTDEGFESRVGTLVENLFPDYSESEENWKAALEAWVEDKLEQEREEQQRRQDARERLQEREEEYGDSITGVGVTPEIQAVYDAVDAVPIEAVAEKYAADEWEPTGRTNHFNPSWRQSNSGESCFVDPSKGTWGDVGDNGGGGPAKLMALAQGIITSPTDDLNGEDYWNAVEALREAGYVIPVHVPEAGDAKQNGDTYAKTPRWAIVDAAQALDVVPMEMFVVKTSGDDSWLDFGSAWAVERTLEELDNIGIDHGWTDDDIPDSDDDEVGLTERYSGTNLGDFLAKIQPPGDVVFEYPVYDVNDRVEAHFIPLTGSQIRLTFTATEQHPDADHGEILSATAIEHKPNTIDMQHDLDTAHKRKTRAKALSDETGINKPEILTVLSEFANDMMDEETQEMLQSPTHRWVDNRVNDVVFYPSEDTSSSEVEVQMQSDPRNPSIGSVQFTMDPEMLNNDSPSGFSNMYVSAFGKTIDIDGSSWSLLADKWLDNARTAERERDNEEDAWIDAFLDAVDNEAKVHADDEAGRTALEDNVNKPRGVYVENWDGVEDDSPRDVVLMPGAWADQFRKNHDFDKASQRVLRKKGILAAPGKKPKSSNGWDKRPTVWAVDASYTKWTRGVVDSADDSDTPGVDPDGDATDRQRGDDQ